MAPNVISTPRLDMAFVNAKGQLTEYGYVLLANIIRRTGGPVNEPFDPDDVLNQLSGLAIQPSPIDYGAQVAALQRDLSIAPPVVVEPRQSSVPNDPGYAALHAEIDALRKRINALEIGYQV